MRACSVYFREKHIYILASAKDIDGVLRNREPFLKAPQSISPRELGERVLQTLDAYQENIARKMYVRGVKQPADPFLSFSGFKSWKAFEKGARYFHISENDSEVTVIPSCPAAKGGFLHEPTMAVRCRTQSDEIGDLLLRQIAAA